MISTKHGKDSEKTAIKQLERQENIQIEPCGLFIDEEFPFLGASPDGICSYESIVKMKCSITASKLGLKKIKIKVVILPLSHYPDHDYL